MRSHILKFGGLLVSALLLVSCGLEPSDVKDSDKDNPNGNLNDSDLITVPMTMRDGSNQQLNLAAATAYSMHVEDCASGYTSTTATEASAGLEVYQFDRDCLAKLKQFEFGGITYTSSAGNASDFSTWLAGDTAAFGDGTNSVSVRVVTQLSNPIVNTDVVEYEFSIVLNGAVQTIAESVVGQSQTMTVGSDEAPNVDSATGAAVELALTSITALGEGVFTIKVECDLAMVGNDCDGVDATAWEAALVEDTLGGVANYSSGFLDGLTYSSGSTVDGGFETNGGWVSPALTGPATIHSKPNLILAIKNGLSYTIFDIDITVVSQGP